MLRLTWELTWELTGDGLALNTANTAPLLPKITLSIVTPTRGDFSEAWLSALLAIEGSVEFILIYHPFAPVREIADGRVRSIVSPYKGEMMQRYVGLLNARGDYLICLDDDDLAHPQLVNLTQRYFARFPKSWVFRPIMAKIDRAAAAESIFAPWPEIPAVEALPVVARRPRPEPTEPYLSELPIAPLDLPFDPRIPLLPGLWKRRDDQGPHIENGNNKIWKREIVAAALGPLSASTEFLGPLKWIPNSGADRLFGLFFQAQSYQAGHTVGHWLLGSAGLIRFVDKDPKYKPPRFHVLTDFLLLKQFPHFGYAWNLFFSKLYGVPRASLKALRWKVLGKPE